MDVFRKYDWQCPVRICFEWMLFMSITSDSSIFKMKQLLYMSIVLVNFQSGIYNVLEIGFSKIFSKRSEIHLSQNVIKYISPLKVEMYLSMDISYYSSRILSKLRCSSHCLNVEKGRHQHFDYCLRFCNICLDRNCYVVEDEFHFLLVCPVYN